ncbi:hypothetical protein JVT61DRAFT_1558 [Boletus reticuloceps]|uniref:Uncharacterized protein n=1 Tax=Boletus reticuloceps TaxID=495285 RepID=A0A8I3ABS8_9AGAM|nr:hypothetical protein JVT61DRAFT_1558 [Boletus reticuloceps]
MYGAGISRQGGNLCTYHYKYGMPIFTQLRKLLNESQVFERQVSPLAFDDSPPASTPWCITVALNGEPKTSLHQPSDLSATVCLEVYASFEFQPMLGTGEHLRNLTTTVDQLLDCSAKHVPFALFPKNGDIVSPCSSILVTVKHNGESSDSSASSVLGPLYSTTGALNELEDAKNHGHSALSRYRKHGEKRDLERSVAEFERALNNCPLDHPCRAAAQSNLAMAKLILCQVEDTIASLEIPIHMYRDAFAARPVGHIDRPSTLVQLAAGHLARFEKQRDDVDGARVEALLHEASELSSTDSHENRAVSFMLQLYAGPRTRTLACQVSSCWSGSNDTVI